MGYDANRSTNSWSFKGYCMYIDSWMNGSTHLQMKRWQKNFKIWDNTTRISLQKGMIPSISLVYYVVLDGSFSIHWNHSIHHKVQCINIHIRLWIRIIHHSSWSVTSYPLKLYQIKKNSLNVATRTNLPQLWNTENWGRTFLLLGVIHIPTRDEELIQ